MSEVYVAVDRGATHYITNGDNTLSTGHTTVHLITQELAKQYEDTLIQLSITKCDICDSSLCTNCKYTTTVLNKARAGQRFLEIAFVWEVGMRVCLCLCVSVPRAIKNYSCEMKSE